MMLAGILLPFAVLRRNGSMPRTASGSCLARLPWMLLGVLLLVSCGGSGNSNSGGSGGGGSPGTAAGKYPVTITAAGGSITQTLAYTLTVS
jgi:hypothetical protein